MPSRTEPVEAPTAAPTQRLSGRRPRVTRPYPAPSEPPSLQEVGPESGVETTIDDTVSAPEQKPESNAERAATPVQSPGRYAIIFGRDGEDGIRSAG